VKRGSKRHSRFYDRLRHSDARAVREASRMIRNLTATPITHVVPMTAAEWEGIEKRSEVTLSSKKGLALSFRRAAPRVADTHSHRGNWGNL